MSERGAAQAIPDDGDPNDPLEGTLRMWEDIVVEPTLTRKEWLAHRAPEAVRLAALAHWEGRRSKRVEKQGHVYLIESAEEPRRFKIGWATDPELRLRDLQSASPLRLRIVATRPGTMVLERKLHQKLKRFRLHGEWFDGAGIDLACALMGER